MGANDNEPTLCEMVGVDLLRNATGVPEARQQEYVWRTWGVIYAFA